MSKQGHAIKGAKARKHATSVGVIVKTEVGRMTIAPDSRWTINATFYHSSKRKFLRDDDNLWYWLYPTRDAIAKAMGVNDSCFTQGFVEQRYSKVWPRVIVTLEKR
jgi:hypothetical protein